MSPKLVDNEPIVQESKETIEQHPAETPAVLNGPIHETDGGLRGWATLTGCWLFQFSMVGTITAFGSYQSFYEEEWLQVSSWIISQIGRMELSDYVIRHIPSHLLRG